MTAKKSPPEEAPAVPQEIGKLLGPVMEQAKPILAEVEAGRMQPEEGAAQLLMSFGGFVDLLPEHAQKLLAHVGVGIYTLVIGTDPVRVAADPQAIAAAQPLSDGERNRLEALEQIVAKLGESEVLPKGSAARLETLEAVLATMNQADSMQPSTPIAPRRVIEPGEPGYDPAKDPRV